MKLASIFFSILVAMSASARITDEQVLTKISGNKIELTTNKGFHFNAEAPANAVFDDLKAIFKPSPKTEKLFVFSAPEQTKKAKLSFYVCDDKKTACEQHQQEVSLDSKSAVPEKNSENRSIAMDLKAEKPTLLVFSAPWCPACLRMQTETFPQGSVKAQFKKMNVKKINIDLPENVELAEKFHVKAIPTAILLNKDDEEVNRWLDYQPAKPFAAQLEFNLKSTITIGELEKKANLGDAAAISRRGMLAHLAYNCEETVKWLSLSKIQKDINYRLAAEVQCAEDKTPEEHLAAFEKAISLTSSKMDKVRWTADLLEKQKENKIAASAMTAQATQALADLEVLSKNQAELKKSFSESTYGDPAGFEKEEAMLIKSKLYGVLDKVEEKQAALNVIRENSQRRKISVERPGQMLLAIAYLREAEEKEKVEKMYQMLLEKYPKTYVYHEKYSRYQLKNKNYDQALTSVNAALQFSEGNKPQLHLLKARVLNEMKNKEQAKQVIVEALKLDNINHKKFKKTLAAIETLKSEIDKQ